MVFEFVEGVTVIKTRVNKGSEGKGSGDDSGGGKVKSDGYDGGHVCGNGMC